jgi:hypothetical protein
MLEIDFIKLKVRFILAQFRFVAILVVGFKYTKKIWLSAKILENKLVKKERLEEPASQSIAINLTSVYLA